MDLFTLSQIALAGSSLFVLASLFFSVRLSQAIARQK
jgi:hypothetical protein